MNKKQSTLLTWDQNQIVIEDVTGYNEEDCLKLVETRLGEKDPFCWQRFPNKIEVIMDLVSNPVEHCLLWERDNNADTIKLIIRGLKEKIPPNQKSSDTIRQITKQGDPDIDEVDWACVGDSPIIHNLQDVVCNKCDACDTDQLFYTGGVYICPDCVADIRWEVNETVTCILDRT